MENNKASIKSGIYKLKRKTNHKLKKESKEIERYKFKNKNKNQIRENIMNKYNHTKMGWIIYIKILIIILIAINITNNVIIVF